MADFITDFVQPILGLSFTVGTSTITAGFVIGVTMATGAAIGVVAKLRGRR